MYKQEENEIEPGQPARPLYSYIQEKRYQRRYRFNISDGLPKPVPNASSYEFFHANECPAWSSSHADAETNSSNDAMSLDHWDSLGYLSSADFSSSLSDFAS